MAEFDPSVPSIARVYDYFLGGKDHFASDRALADRMIEMAPLAPVITRDLQKNHTAGNLMIVSPDVGGVARARAIAQDRKSVV